MAANKLNVLHWHLVDDQGWRLEMPKYPRLTSISAWRRAATAPGAPPLPVEGGFYTRAQIRQIVAYAAARHITIVPEIEMPGHALAAIRAYPRLGMGVPIPPGTESDYGVFPWLYNTDDATFRFLENVLDEVMDLFPSPYIHVGGDEAVKDQWKASPAIQAQMKALGITSEDKLQGWFVARIGKYLAAHRRRLIGWDEILEGDVPADATIMSWRGIDGAVAAAKAGHDTVLSPAPTLYFDNRQGVDAAEGPGRGTLESLATVYGFDPAPASIPAAEQRHILGLQGNLWTEHVRGDARAAQMAFPRASAVAELGWSPAGHRDFADFVRRLSPQMARMKALGISGSAALFRPVVTLSPEGAKARIALTGQSGLPIRYTLDGSAPGAASPLYAAPFNAAFPARLRAASFLNGTAQPGAIELPVTSETLRHRDDTQLDLCSGKVPLRLEDDWPATGKRAAFLIDIEQPCWIYRAAPMDDVTGIAIDVGQLPFNFQIGDDVDGIHFAPPVTPAGEFEVRDGCDGDRIAMLPLAPAARNPGVTRLSAALPPLKGAHDLCFTYTAHGVNPLWAISAVQLETAR
jgi:hexosaminidase